MPSKYPLNSDFDSSRFLYIGSANTTSTSLIFGLKNDESEAWQRFMKIYIPLIRHWCYRQNGSLTRSDRQDITQEVAAKVSRAIKEFDICREGWVFRAWLRRITQNTIADFLERDGKRKGIFKQLNDRNDISDFTFPPQSLESEAEDKIIILRQILKILRPHFTDENWEILNLFIQAGKTSGEVAQIMNMKGDTVRKIKNRMLNRIREEYKACGIDEKPIFYEANH